MRRERTLGVILAATALFAVPASAQRQEAEPLASVALPAELERVLTDYETAWTARDAAGLAALFAPDGFVMAPGMPPRRGRDAIEAYYTGRGGPLSLRALAYAAEGDIGWIIGGYAAAEGLPDGGKFSLTLRRGDDGRWLIVTDMDNGN
jgi:ketosteroid isomerase-like protein